MGGEGEAEVELIKAVIEYARGSEAVAEKIDFYLQLLYERDVLSDSGVLTWHARRQKQMRKGALSDLEKTLVGKCQWLVDMLQESEEEEEEEEDGSSSSSSSSS